MSDKIINRTVPNEIRNQHGERLEFTYHFGAARFDLQQAARTE